MTNITFQRVIRDCPANDAQTDPRQLIADFDVYIGGEHRATWSRESYSKGYSLYGLDREPIYSEHANGRPDYNMRHCRTKVDKKADFAAVTEGLLMSNLIPTLEDYRQRQLGRGRALLEAEDLHRIASQDHAIKEWGKSLYEMLKLLVDGCDLKIAAGTLKSQIDQRVDQLMAFHRERWSPDERDDVAAFEASLKMEG